MNNAPIKTFRSRGLEVAVWTRHTDEHTFYTITAKRSYKDKATDEWKDSQFIDSDDIPLLAAMMTRAYHYIQFQREAS